jgi:hypothetical protein
MGKRASGKLLVRVAIPEAGAKVVAASLPQKSEAHSPLKKHGMVRSISEYDPDVICEVAFVHAWEFEKIADMIGHSTVCPVWSSRGEHAVYDSRRDVSPFWRGAKVEALRVCNEALETRARPHG